MNEILFIIGILIPALSYYGIGVRIVKYFTKNSFNSNHNFSGFIWALGCIVHIFLAYLTYRRSIGILYSFWISYFFLTIFSYKDIKKSFLNILEIKNLKINLSYLLFLTITFCLGVSLFDINDGIKTIWTNNYADLPFHLGVITNYVHGTSPLIDYHIFPGKSFSYTILFNFWTACLWAPLPEYKLLDLIFIIQWTMTWSVIYLGFNKIAKVNGFKNDIYPWVVLFAGGSFPQFLSNLNIYFDKISKGFSHLLIEQGYPLTCLLSTVWVPQRSSLIGLAIAGVTLTQFLITIYSKKNYLISKHEYEGSIISLGILLGLGVLANLHIILTVVFSISIVLLWDMILNFQLIKKKSFSEFYFLLSFLICSIIPLSVLSSKSGIIELINGWMMPSNSNLLDIFKMWASNLYILGLLILFILWKLPIRYSLSLIILFLLGNIIKLSSWEWDNYKFFIGIFLVLIFYSSYFVRMNKYIELLFVISILPGIYETSKVFLKENLITVYTEDQLFKASEIRDYTSGDSIIASNTDHNSVITLSGRRIFVGYEGWLSSHAIDYKDRLNLNNNILELSNCNKDNNKLCPDYYFSENKININYLYKTEVPGLYKFTK